MAVRSVAGDEDPAGAIRVGNREAQVPESDMVELDVEQSAYSLLHIRAEIEVVLRRARRHRRMEEPRGAQVDPAEELPVTLELGLQHAVVRLAGIAREQLVQPTRA